VTAFLAKQDWGLVFRMTAVPHVDLNAAYLMTLVGFLGTTISPYLFFWQASEEVEEEIAGAKIADFSSVEPGVTLRDIKELGTDTRIGMVFSNAMTFFILITTAATLHKGGILDIETPQQAALRADDRRHAQDQALDLAGSGREASRFPRRRTRPRHSA